MIDQLYHQEAPYIPRVGHDRDEDVVQDFQGGDHYLLHKGTETLQFQTLEGLHGFRCARIAAREDDRLTEEERRIRIENFLLHHQRV